VRLFERLFCTPPQMKTCSPTTVAEALARGLGGETSEQEWLTETVYQTPSPMLTKLKSLL